MIHSIFLRLPVQSYIQTFFTSCCVLYIHYSRLNELYQSLKYELSEKKRDRALVSAPKMRRIRPEKSWVSAALVHMLAGGRCCALPASAGPCQKPLGQ